MSRRSAEPTGTARVAVVGAGSAAGTRVREALVRAGVPGERVDLYGSTGGETVLTEYGDEARLMQEPDLAELGRRDVVFSCEDGDHAARLACLASSGHTVLDLADGLKADPRRRLVQLDGAGDTAPVAGAILAVPHELTILLLEVLGPLGHALGVEEATAFALRPAADFGDVGLDELRAQTVRLLQFERVPRELFARQLAFNVVPQFDLENPAFSTEARVAEETGRLLEWPAGRLAVRVAVVAVFFGHSLQLRIRGRGTAADARSALESGGVRLAGRGRAAPRTPLEAAAEGATTVVDVSDDGIGGIWAWVVAGDLPARRADLAVRIAARVCDL